MSARTRVGLAVIGFGWMGQAHSRAAHRIRLHFPDRDYDPRLVICADAVAERRELAVRDYDFAEATGDWRAAIEHPDVDAVYIAGPNMMHVEAVEAAAAAGKHVFCEKPVGGTPQQTLAAARAVRAAGVISAVGYNYRWSPLVLHARQLLLDGQLGDVTNWRGRFLSMYGADPLGVLSWRYRLEEGGYGVTSDLLSHSVDLAMFFLGPITRVVGTTDTVIRERPVPPPGASHYGRGLPEHPTGPVTNEDYVSMLCQFASGAQGVFESSRTMVGPESQMAFDVHGTKGAAGWSLERMNELQLNTGEGYTRIFGGDRFPYHGNFVPGSANSIGFEDLVTIEDYEFCRAVAAGEPYEPGLNDALAAVTVQDALLRSVASGRWEDVTALDAELGVASSAGAQR